MTSPSQTLASISAEGWASMVPALYNNLAMSSSAASCPVQQGWRLLAMGNRFFTSLDEVRAHRPPRRGRAWIRVHGPRPNSVKLPLSRLGSVSLWREAIRLTPLGMVLRKSPDSGLHSAADAWAAGLVGGIGGWWQLSPAEPPESCGWCSLQLGRHDVPANFDLPEGLQHCIPSL